jgi:hypothetical protein
MMRSTPGIWPWPRHAPQPIRWRIVGAGTSSVMLAVVVLTFAAASFHRAYAASPLDDAPQAEAATAPVRNDNIWAGRDHQPSRFETESSEERDHETTPQVEQRSDDEVLKIQRRLEQTEKRYPPGFLESRP